MLYRLVLHHVVYQGPLAPLFAEAARLLRPGGALVAVEPGLWHPVGAGLELANRLGLGPAVHGTPDDIPISPRALVGHAARRRPRARAARGDLRLAAAPRARAAAAPRARPARARDRALAPFGHTLMLIARKPAPSAPGP